MNTTSNKGCDEGKQRLKVKREMVMGMEYEEAYDQMNSWDQEDKKKKGVFLGSGSAKKASAAVAVGAAMRCCQAEKCTSDLSDAKQYHRRHKVCELHSKAQFVMVGGIRQRFCQQCSRFHELSEFDEAKRSCRRRLAGHNERRRKSASDQSHVEGSSRKGTGSQLKDLVCGQVDERGRIQITIQENATYKHFQIR